MDIREKQALVSVIIPVYKTEKYLAECIDSVIIQKLSKKHTKYYIEIICVNDGSPDNSKNILLKYMADHSNIILLEQQNSGQSVARNNALGIAKGKYIMFLDSDDLLPQDAISSLIAIAEETKSEVIVSHSKAFNSRRSWYIEAHSEVASASLRKVKFFHKSILMNTPPPWGKLYSKNLLTRNDIKFPVGIKLAEDWIFVISAMYKANHISSTPAVTYLYRGRDDEDNPSCTQIVNEKVFEDLIKVYALTNQFKLPPRQTWLAKLFILRGILYRLTKFSADNNFLACKKIYQELNTFLKKSIGYDILKVFTPSRRLPMILIYHGYYSEAHRILNKKYQKSCLKHAAIVKDNLIIEDYLLLKSKNSLRSRISFKVKKIIKSHKKLSWNIQYKTASLVARTFYRKRNICLIGERLGNTANDSSYHLFKYAQNSFPRKNKLLKFEYFYVIKKDAPTAINIINNSNVVYYGSLKHFIIFHAAKKYIFSDSMRDIFFRWKDVASQHITKPRYFLQHGIFALNRATGYYDQNSMEKRLELPHKFIVSSEHERNLVCKNFGFEKNQVAVTGLSRFDFLPKKKNSPTKKIFIMFTWRDNLSRMSTEQFQQSSYYKKLIELLSNPLINKLLQNYGYTLEACLHHKLHKYLRTTTHLSGYKIHSMNDVDVQSLIINSDMMITDYSSASFDMLYQNKPVLYYWFDQEKFFAARGGPLINPLTDMPGTISKDINDLYFNLEKMIKNNCLMEKADHDKSKIFFKYKDNLNSKRILDLIEEN